MADEQQVKEKRPGGGGRGPARSGTGRPWAGSTRRTAWRPAGRGSRTRAAIARAAIAATGAGRIAGGWKARPKSSSKS